MSVLIPLTVVAARRTKDHNYNHSQSAKLNSFEMRLRQLKRTIDTLSIYGQ